MTTPLTLRGLRAVAIVRRSKKQDEHSTSVEGQQETIAEFADREGIVIVGWAIDPAVSAFRVPPDKRRQVREWFGRADEFDLFLYYRQDRFVRRTMDFMGMVTWCKANGKKMFSATEDSGDVTEHMAMLPGFLRAWLGEGESESISARVKASQERLHRAGRYTGGKLPFFLYTIPNPDGPGYVKTVDPDKAPLAREITTRVINGLAIFSVASDLNKRGIPAPNGGLWSTASLCVTLRNRALLDYGILDADEWNRLQAALLTRKQERTIQTKRVWLAKNLFSCNRCGGPIHHWSRKANGRRYGRCDNYNNKALGGRPKCDLPQTPMEIIEAGIKATIDEHADWVIEERLTDHARQAKLEDVGKRMMALMPELQASMIDREEFLSRMAELTEEQEQLRNATHAPGWRPSGETVGQRWARLTDAERRMWLLHAGIRWTVDKQTRTREDGRQEERWVVADNWGTAAEHAGIRERLARP